ncbi:MAG TPA: CYTH domain-containing protein [Thermoclostridium sp.]|nr:CYTH domain-containing protein [Clostridiaceae bacterium]HOQ75379.1 CYTH domain-containing protein [Thermoclostridium sp.]HPU44643.1 CYTH domain-containing protein [Thermoclostridium sp.]
MGKEIERKFLVKDCSYKDKASSCKVYRQGYISVQPDRVIRVRTDGERGYLTLKGPSSGVARLEYEYEIPLPDAEEMLSLMCDKPIIEKRRYIVFHEGVEWEVDEFEGENQGLCIAEIELEQEGQSFSLPPWIGPEVTGDPRYYNANLVKSPYKSWKQRG